MNFFKSIKINLNLNPQALNLGLVLTKLHKAIKFNQKVWLKPYINMNTELRKNAKNFGKTTGNVRKHRYKARNNLSKKGLFSVTAKLLYKKKFWKLGGKLMTEFAALRPKTYSYLGWWWWKQKGKRHKKV